MNDAPDSHIELIVPVDNKGSQTYHFAFPESARAGSVLLFLLKGARDKAKRTFDLSTPLFDLSRFRYPTVNLSQSEPQDADQALNRYLDHHAEVFKILEVMYARKEELTMHLRNSLLTLVLFLLMAVGMAFLLYGGINLSDTPTYHAVVDFLRPLFPWLIGVPLALHLTTMWVAWRFLRTRMGFLTPSDWVLLKTHQMERDLTPDEYKKHLTEKTA